MTTDDLADLRGPLGQVHLQAQPWACRATTGRDGDVVTNRHLALLAALGSAAAAVWALSWGGLVWAVLFLGLAGEALWVSLRD